MNGPVPYLKGKGSECHRVRNAKRPREGSNSRTVSNYYIDNTHYMQLYFFIACMYQRKCTHIYSDYVFCSDRVKIDRHVFTVICPFL